MITSKKIRDLYSDAITLKDHMTIFIEQTKQTKCDKKGIGFNKDLRFSAFSAKLSFDSWRGFYGDSNCSSVIRLIDSETASKSLVKYAELHQKEILDFIHDDLMQQAITLKNKAIDEMEEEKSFINSIDIKENQS